MHPFEVAYDIAHDPGLQRRVLGLLGVKAENATRVERALIRTGADTLLAEEIAANPTIRSTVQTALDGGAVSVADALDQVPDSDIEYVALQQLTFLQA